MQAAGQPFVSRQIQATNRDLLRCLSDISFEDASCPQDAFLGKMVDGFAEELDQMRQQEEISPNKLELLVASLKAGSYLD